MWGVFCSSKTNDAVYKVTPFFNQSFLWRNRLARLAVNQKVGGSSPPRDVDFVFAPGLFYFRTGSLAYHSRILRNYCRQM